MMVVVEEFIWRRDSGEGAGPRRADGRRGVAEDGTGGRSRGQCREVLLLSLVLIVAGLY